MRLSRQFERAAVRGATGLAFLTTLTLVSVLALASTQSTLADFGGPSAAGSSWLTSSNDKSVNVDIPASACPNAGLSACAGQTLPYSHSWYIDNPTFMASLGHRDALWLNAESAKNGCSGTFLTVLDFGHPSMKYASNASPLDNYSISLFGTQPGEWMTDRQIEGLAEQYLDAWHAAATSCPHLVLAMGTSNYGECLHAVGNCGIGQAGQTWDMAVHDVMNYVATKGYGNTIAGVWMADDLEGSWDGWSKTVQFLQGVRAQEHTYSVHAHLVDYGDADSGACSELTGSCADAWSQQDVYSAAWGIGWDLPLPETYYPNSSNKWVAVNNSVGAMQFAGVMTECSGGDPLPAGSCWTGHSNTAGDCELSPTQGYSLIKAGAPKLPIAYATNMEWPEIQTSRAAC